MQEQWWGTMLSPSITTFHKRPLTFMLCTATQCPPLHRAVALFSTLSKFIFIFHVSPYWLIYLLYSHRSCKPHCCHLTHGLPWYVFFFSFHLPFDFLLTLTAPSVPWHHHHLDTWPSQCSGSHSSTVNNPSRGELWADTTTAHTPATNMGQQTSTTTVMMVTMTMMAMGGDAAVVACDNGDGGDMRLD